MRDACELHRVFLWAYTLMDNHVHHIAVPAREDSLGRAIKETHGEYTSYLNTKYGLVGHAWQGRFKFLSDGRVALLECDSLCREKSGKGWHGRKSRTLRLVECGRPLRSAEDMLLSGDCPVVREIKNWSEWLRLENAKGVDDVIRLHTRTGRPLGSKGFIGGIEEQKGRKLLPQKRGPRSKLKQAEITARTVENRQQQGRYLGDLYVCPRIT